jgi:hypothetical protein
MKVKFDDLDTAFLSSSEQISNWVDRKTGKVILIDLDDIFLSLDYVDDDEAQAIQEISILLGEAENPDNLEIDENRYVCVSPPDSNEKWRWMEEFALAQQDNPKLFNQLVTALRGRKPFRNFKDALLDFPEDRENWFAFENQKVREFIEDWAKSEKIDVDYD